MTQPDSPPPQFSPVFSVVVPVRDEAGNIAPLVAEIHAALRGRAYEIIYVDDGSADATAAELAALDDPRLRVLRHDRSCGQSQALITGVGGARGEWIVTLDGDGQNDPADIAALMAAGAPAADTLYIGHRTNRHDGAMRRFASCVAYYARRLMLGDPTPDAGCGLRLIPRDLFLALPRFDALHRFMAVLVIRAGGRVVSVPVGHRPRLRGRSKYGIWARGLVGLVDLLGVRWLLARHSRPARTP